MFGTSAEGPSRPDPHAVFRPRRGRHVAVVGTVHGDLHRWCAVDAVGGSATWRLARLRPVAPDLLWPRGGGIAVALRFDSGRSVDTGSGDPQSDHHAPACVGADCPRAVRWRRALGARGPR